MVMSIKKRIKDSLDENDRDRALNYIEWIRSTASGFDQNVRRDTTIFLLLIAIFEVVIQSRKSTLSIASFTVTRDSIVLVFIPAIVSYLFLQIAIDTQKLNRLDTAFRETFKIWSPKASENDLDSILGGSKPAYWSVAGIEEGGPYRFYNLEFSLSVVFMLAIMAGLLAFEAQAYYVLFPVHISAIAAWVISLLITLYCLVYGLLFAYTETGA